MVSSIVELGERENRIVTIVKGKYGLRTKSEAINLIITEYEQGVLEPHLRPEYAERLGRLTKEKGKRYSSIEAFDKEHA